VGPTTKVRGGGGRARQQAQKRRAGHKQDFLPTSLRKREEVREEYPFRKPEGGGRAEGGEARGRGKSVDPHRRRNKEKPTRKKRACIAKEKNAETCRLTMGREGREKKKRLQKKDSTSPRKAWSFSGKKGGDQKRRR